MLMLQLEQRESITVGMEGLFFAALLVIVAVVGWWFFDESLVAIRGQRKESEREAIRRGEMNPPPTAKEIVAFTAALIAMFVFIGWLGLS